MKKLLLLGMTALLSVTVFSKSIPDLQIANGTGSAEVHGDAIYYFGDATNERSDAAISISSNRAFMAAVLYKNTFYTIGGLDSDANAVNNVEFIFAGLPTAVEKVYNVTEDFKLSQNYPNPFTQSTKIRYSVPSVTRGGFAGSLVTIKIYNTLGIEVSTIVNESMPAGSYEINFDASALSSGAYFCKLQTGLFSAARTMHCIR